MLLKKVLFEGHVKKKGAWSFVDDKIWNIENKIMRV